MMASQTHNPNRRRAGFTLLELILAVTVTAIVSAALFSSMSGVFKTRRKTEDHLAGREAARAIMELVRSDLQCVPPAGGRVRGVFLGENTRGMSNVDTDNMTFITANPALRTDQDTADLRQVELRLLTSSEDPDHYVLARLVTGNLLATVVPDPALQVLARRVVSLNLRYYDGAEWLDEWDSSELDNAIPQAVEIVLVTDPGQSREPEDEIEREQNYITTVQVVRLPAAGEVEGVGGELFGF